MYIVTASKIFSIQKDTARLQRGDSQKHGSEESDKDRLVGIFYFLREIDVNQNFNFRYFLYLRLFIVMGVTWVIKGKILFKDVHI